MERDEGGMAARRRASGEWEEELRRIALRARARLRGARERARERRERARDARWAGQHAFAFGLAHAAEAQEAMAAAAEEELRALEERWAALAADGR